MSDKGAPRDVPIDRSQVRLLPLDVDRLIADNHVARRIWRLISSLDLGSFERDIRAVVGVAGRPSHSPQVLISLWLYAFTRGLHSAREIERQMDYEPALRWLTGLAAINHHTLSDFRVSHGQALRVLFEDVLALMMKKRLVTLQRVAVDGTEIRADVNKKSFRQKDKIEEYLQLAREHLDGQKRQADGSWEAPARRLLCRQVRLGRGGGRVGLPARQASVAQRNATSEGAHDPHVSGARAGLSGVSGTAVVLSGFKAETRWAKRVDSRV